jgi:predicted RND superfamily exporter protein
MSRFQRLILGFVGKVVRWPKLTLLFCVIGLVVAAVGAKLFLPISTDTNDLVNPKLPFFADYLRFIDRFPENEAIYITLQAKDEQHPPEAARWGGAADAVAGAVGQLHDAVGSVEWRVDATDLGNQGLIFDTAENVHRAAKEVLQTDSSGHSYIDLLKLWGERPGLAVGLLGPTPTERFLKGSAFRKPEPDSVGLTALLADSWLAAMQHPELPLKVGTTLPDFATLELKDPSADPTRLGYYYIVDARDEGKPNPRHLLLIRVYPKRNFDSLDAVTAPLNSIRAAARAAAAPWKDFVVHITGRPVLEADELAISDEDTQRAEICAGITVFVGLVMMLTPWRRVRGRGAFRAIGAGIWMALVAELSLGIGIGWTFGWTTISIGRLNLLSLVFVIALIGIGMDYLIQILMRYKQEKARHAEPEAVWRHVFRYVSMPIITACMGAAGAFFVAEFTQFTGAAELGVIAGGGLLLCLFAGFTALPALLTLFPVNFTEDRTESVPDINQMPTRRTPWLAITPIIWVIALLAGIPLMLRTTLDSDLLGLQAGGLESVEMIRSLPSWYGVVMSKDLDQLRRVRAGFLKSPTVASTDSVLDALDNRDWLLKQTLLVPLTQIAWTAPTPPTGTKLKDWAAAADGLVNAWKNDPLAAKAVEGQDLRNLLLTLSRVATLWRENAELASANQHMADWQTEFINLLKVEAGQFQPPPLDMNRLPDQLRTHYISKDGFYALYVYPKADLWDPKNQPAFVHDVEAAATAEGTTATGIAVQLFHSVETIRHAFFLCTLYALALIFVLVAIDLRSIVDTLLAISVLGLGLPVLLAAMQFFHVQWNFANFFGMPILIGAGHEYGVFMVHRYREALHDPKRVWRRWDISDFALLLCGFVTSSSFGYLMIARHQGIKSLGEVMCLGTACIYLATVAALRPVLLWLLKRRQPAPSAAS